mgnify:FL=1
MEIKNFNSKKRGKIMFLKYGKTYLDVKTLSFCGTKKTIKSTYLPTNPTIEGYSQTKP